MSKKTDIVNYLRNAPSQQLTTRTIARKLSVKPSQIFDDLMALARVGLIEDGNKLIRVTMADKTWRLKSPMND